jgi:hypothetical protein
LQRQTTTVAEVLKLVTCLPDQLYNFYDRILESVSDKTLRRYLTRALFYLSMTMEVQATNLAAMSALNYQSWHSWFGNCIEKPVTREDILTPLNGLIVRKKREYDDDVFVQLAHFSVAEYLALATTQPILQEYEFPSSMVGDDGSRLMGLRVYALYVYSALYPDRLNDGDWYTYKIQYLLNQYVRGTVSPADYKVLYWLGWMWRAHRLLFDMVMNIICVYSCHAKRCWELKSVAPFAFDLEKLGSSYDRGLSGVWPLPLFYVCLGVWQLSRFLPWVLSKLLALCVLLTVDVPFTSLTLIGKDTNKERIFLGALVLMAVPMVLNYAILLSLFTALLIVFLLIFVDIVK